MAFELPSFLIPAGEKGPMSPSAVKRKQAIVDAMIKANATTPENIGQGINALSRGLVANVRGGQADAGEAAGSAKAQAVIDALMGKGSDAGMSDYAGALADPWVQENPGMSAIAQAGYGQELKEADPAYQMGLEKMGLEMDALRNPQPDPMKPTSDMQEYDYAKSQGFEGSFVDFQNAMKGNGLSITTADGTVIQQGGGKLTEGQAKDLGFLARGAEANKQLRTMDEQLTNFGQSTLAPLLPLGLGNYTKSPEFRQAKVAADQFLTVILRKDTGAAVTPQEFDLYGPMFLPVPGDDKGTIEQKRRMRDVAVLAIQSGLGTAEAIGKANLAVLGLDDAAQSLGATPANPAAAAPADTIVDAADFFKDALGAP